MALIRPAAGPQVFPALALDDWRDTKETLHRFTQVVGKIRLAAGPRRNHWWNVPFHLTGRGITTRPTRDPATGRMFAVDFDFVAHRLEISALDGRRTGFPLAGHSVASFYEAVTAGLDQFGVRARPRLPHPFDLPDSARPFARDTEHRAYDPDAVSRYWRILSAVAWELEAFSAGWGGKISPVHHFWHTFDLAVSRFSGRTADPGAAADPVTREAYSREVISSGFWFGDDTFPAPAFYSYTAPAPDGIEAAPLLPAAARWAERGGSWLAVLPYDDVRRAGAPHRAVQDFYRTSYRAGADLAGWPAGLECPEGVTDPVLAAHRRAERRADAA